MSESESSEVEGSIRSPRIFQLNHGIDNKRQCKKLVQELLAKSKTIFGNLRY